MLGIPQSLMVGPTFFSPFAVIHSLCFPVYLQEDGHGTGSNQVCVPLDPESDKAE